MNTSFSASGAHRNILLRGTLALLVLPFGAQAQTQSFASASPSTTELGFTSSAPATFYQPTGSAGFGAYGVAAGATTTITTAERVIPANTAAGSKFSFDLANPVGSFNTTSTVQVWLSIDRAAFAQELDIISSINAGSYLFNQYISGNDASGVVTKTSNGTSTTITAIATTGGSPNQRPVSRVIINLPASTALAGKYVTARIVLNSASGATMLIDNLALTLANGTSPLPIELTRFGAVPQAAGVALAWATASEKNSAYFEVQRSANAEAYATIGKVAAQGSSTSAREYAFVDAQPLAGSSYYRLHQVDNDGTDAYSPVVAVQRKGLAEASVYPNPGANFLVLPAATGALHYRIFNTLGQALLSGQAAGSEHLDITSLPTGTFFLELSAASGRHTQRLVRE